MKTKNVIRSFSLALTLTLGLTSCGNNASEAGSVGNGSSDSTSCNSGMRIAYVEMDSLMSQYNFCKEASLILEKKRNNAINTLESKAKQLQTAENNFQQKYNNNGFASQEEANKLYNNLQRQGQDLQELKARLDLELANEMDKFNKTLRDSIQNFLKDYNAVKKFDIILTNSETTTIVLHANKKHDITQGVVDGLNKRYTSIEDKADSKK